MLMFWKLVVSYFLCNIELNWICILNSNFWSRITPKYLTSLARWIWVFWIVNRSVFCDFYFQHKYFRVVFWQLIFIFLFWEKSRMLLRSGIIFKFQFLENCYKLLRSENIYILRTPYLKLRNTCFKHTVVIVYYVSLK